MNKRINLNHEDILEAIKKFAMEKYKKELEGEEFEIVVIYDSYNVLVNATIDYID